MKTLKINEIVVVEHRIYKIIKSKYSKNKKGDETGLRVILRLLTEKELNEMLFQKLNEKIEKGKT